MLKQITLATMITLAALPASAFELAPDKIGHSVVGAGIGFGVTKITNKPELGCAAAAGAGAAKEIWDSTGRGHVEFADFAFTAAAGCLASFTTFTYTIDRSPNSTPSFDLMPYPGELKGLF